MIAGGAIEGEASLPTALKRVGGELMGVFFGGLFDIPDSVGVEGVRYWEIAFSVCLAGALLW